MKITAWKFRGSQKTFGNFHGEGVTWREWNKGGGNVIDMHGSGYGIMNGATNARQESQAAGFDYLYADGPYFLRRKAEEIRLAWTTNWYQLGDGPERTADLNARGVEMKPWRKVRGSTVYVCPSAHLIHQFAYGDDADEWVEATMAEIKRHTDRPVQLRWKNAGNNNIEQRTKSMEKCFDDAWAIVTAGSTIGCEALVYGVPVISTQKCAASPLALDDVSQIEAPFEPDDDERWRWANNLAARQFDNGMLRSGQAWAIMREDYEDMNGTHRQHV
jgi:hypothetical protein